MAGRLGPVAAAGHVAPDPATGPGLIEEHPAARVVGADPDPLGAAVLDLVDERVGEAGEGVVERVANVAVADRDAVGLLDELDALAGADRPIDLGEGLVARGPVMGDRVSQWAASSNVVRWSTRKPDSYSSVFMKSEVSSSDIPWWWSSEARWLSVVLGI